MSEEREQDILEDEDEVEAHKKHHDATAEPTDDEENDVEAHKKFHD